MGRRVFNVLRHILFYILRKVDLASNKMLFEVFSVRVEIGSNKFYRLRVPAGSFN
jgi:hypothetical protein